MVIFSAVLEPPAVTAGVFVDADTVKFLSASVTVAVLLTPPLEPVMVSAELPPSVAAVVVTVSVLVPDPEMDVGLNVAVAPLGSPVTASAVDPGSVPVAVTVTVTVPLPPAFIVGLPEAEIVSVPTCSAADADRTALPLVPLIVNE
jgi:hypothetical protein